MLSYRLKLLDSNQLKVGLNLDLAFNNVENNLLIKKKFFFIHAHFPKLKLIHYAKLVPVILYKLNKCNATLYMGVILCHSITNR